MSKRHILGWQIILASKPIMAQWKSWYKKAGRLYFINGIAVGHIFVCLVFHSLLSCFIIFKYSSLILPNPIGSHTKLLIFFWLCSLAYSLFLRNMTLVFVFCVYGGNHGRGVSSSYMVSPNPIIQALDGAGVISYLLLSDRCVGEQGEEAYGRGSRDRTEQTE